MLTHDAAPVPQMADGLVQRSRFRHHRLLGLADAVPGANLPGYNASGQVFFFHFAGRHVALVV